MSYFDMVKLDPVNNYYLYTLPELEDLKKRISPEKVKALKKDLEDLFNLPLESVTTREQPAPGGNVHDYVSLATYWWPNEQTPTGYPYVNRDGYVNPEGLRYDKDKLRRVAYLVYHSILVFFLAGEDRWLELANKHLFNWFINEPSRMNPNMEHGQFIPGKSTGRREGIIDYSANFPYALNMIYLLDQKQLLEKKLAEGLRDWHGQFRCWLLDSEIGRSEGMSENNHGTFYDFALSMIEQFLGMPEQTAARKESFIKERLLKQIARDGSLPRETAWTKSLSYTFMGLKGLLDTARLMPGGKDFPLLRSSTDWLYNTAIVHRESWPYPQVTPFDEGIYLVFRQTASAMYGPGYQDVTARVDPEKILNKVLTYLFM